MVSIALVRFRNLSTEPLNNIEDKRSSREIIQSESQIDGLKTFEKILEVCYHQQIHPWLPLHTLKLRETYNPPTGLHISMEPTMPIGRTE
ncbi:hypothetical protein GQ457_06G013500 [Hibiscus cannabinus]